MNDAWAFNAHRCPTSVHVEFQREIERLVRSVVQNRDHIAIAVVTEEIVIAADRVEVLIAHALQPMINPKHTHSYSFFERLDGFGVSETYLLLHALRKPTL